MKKLHRLILSLLLLLFLFPSNVWAHPGKTDGKGGHTDHSTGEYHYHHGYPEHDHYDMNGDGSVDCPYDFEDKPRQDNGSGFVTKREPANNKKNHAELIAYIAVLLYPTIMFILPNLIKR